MRLQMKIIICYWKTDVDPCYKWQMSDELYSTAGWKVQLLSNVLESLAEDIAKQNVDGMA